MNYLKIIHPFMNGFIINIMHYIDYILVYYLGNIIQAILVFLLYYKYILFLFKLYYKYILFIIIIKEFIIVTLSSYLGYITYMDLFI